MQEKNQILFLTIAEGKLYKAQKLLQKAALQDPCGVSYQNLGVFYAKEGLQLRSGRGRRADHLARHWLEKAMQINDTKGIRWALGYLALGQEQSLAALAQFQSAYRLFPEDWTSAYHCAVCCCRLHRDAEMLQWSRKMQPLADEEWREESLEMYAFALYLSDGDSSELRTLLQPDDVSCMIRLLSLLPSRYGSIMRWEWEKWRCSLRLHDRNWRENTILPNGKG